ncbi:hypothetical protein AAC387_Pa03g4195 [Persea americana]
MYDQDSPTATPTGTKGSSFPTTLFLHFPSQRTCGIHKRIISPSSTKLTRFSLRILVQLKRRKATEKTQRLHYDCNRLLLPGSSLFLMQEARLESNLFLKEMILTDTQIRKRPGNFWAVVF